MVFLRGNDAVTCDRDFVERFRPTTSAKPYMQTVRRSTGKPCTVGDLSAHTVSSGYDGGSTLVSERASRFLGIHIRTRVHAGSGTLRLKWLPLSGAFGRNLPRTAKQILQEKMLFQQENHMFFFVPCSAGRVEFWANNACTGFHAPHFSHLALYSPCFALYFCTSSPVRLQKISGHSSCR